MMQVVLTQGQLTGQTCIKDDLSSFKGHPLSHIDIAFNTSYPDAVSVCDTAVHLQTAIDALEMLCAVWSFTTVVCSAYEGITVCLNQGGPSFLQSELIVDEM